jgi:uncharacterized protein with PQ loop repeat
MSISAKPEVLVFAILGNTLNVAHNIPFVYQVLKNKSSRNISGMFLAMRFTGSVSWIIYSILVSDIWIGSCYAVSVISTIMIGYVKCIDRQAKRINNNIEEVVI